MSIADALGKTTDKIATAARHRSVFAQWRMLIDSGSGDNHRSWRQRTAIFDSTVTNFGDLPIALLSVSTGKSPNHRGPDMIPQVWAMTSSLAGKDIRLSRTLPVISSGTGMAYDISGRPTANITLLKPDRQLHVLRDIVSIEPAFGGNDVSKHRPCLTDIILGATVMTRFNRAIVDNLTDVVFGDKRQDATLNKNRRVWTAFDC